MLSSANAFNLDKFKNLPFGKDLKKSNKPSVLHQGSKSSELDVQWLLHPQQFVQVLENACKCHSRLMPQYVSEIVLVPEYRALAGEQHQHQQQLGPVL